MKLTFINDKYSYIAQLYLQNLNVKSGLALLNNCIHNVLHFTQTTLLNFEVLTPKYKVISLTQSCPAFPYSYYNVYYDEYALIIK